MWSWFPFWPRHRLGCNRASPLTWRTASSRTQRAGLRCPCDCEDQTGPSALSTWLARNPSCSWVTLAPLCEPGRDQRSADSLSSDLSLAPPPRVDDSVLKTKLRG